MRFITICRQLPRFALATAFLLAAHAPCVAAAGDDAEVESAANAKQLDQRVRTALESEGLEFEVDEKGDAKVILRFTDDGDRTQLVIVQSGTFSYRKSEFREIFAAALKADEDKGLDLQLARRLMEESSRSKLAFWGIEDGVIWAIARIPADAPAGTLREAIDFVAVRADDLEKERLGTDEF